MLARSRSSKVSFRALRQPRVVACRCGRVIEICQKPKQFKGASDTKDVNNFLWSVEPFFRATGIEKDALKISNVATTKALFSFLDGFELWEKMELHRKGVQDLMRAMVVAKSLVESPKNHIKEKRKKSGRANNGHSSDEERRVRDCPTKVRLSTIVRKLEESKAEGNGIIREPQGELGNIRVIRDEHDVEL
ncbi:hypothetical protein CXB51_011586 [Gossypium anomalum]|uniref:Uncharacterized protein n=1 Tax=Gossypium anomalum TaxID=47600 RepID=A0A8J5ZAG1_9ROSI|nr:hypothetical protein CXB51_011586 [Gossypium anomalum]